MCDCFTCKNSNNRDALIGYYTAEIEYLTAIIDKFQQYGVKEGSISDKDIGGEYAGCSYTLMASKCLLNEIQHKQSKLIEEFLIEGDYFG